MPFKDIINVLMFLCCTKQDYLQSLVADSKEYSTVFDILNHYEALHAARMELTERQEEDLATLQRIHSNMVKSIEVTQHMRLVKLVGPVTLLTCILEVTGQISIKTPATLTEVFCDFSVTPPTCSSTSN